MNRRLIWLRLFFLRTCLIKLSGVVALRWFPTLSAFIKIFWVLFPSSWFLICQRNKIVIFKVVSKWRCLLFQRSMKFNTHSVISPKNFNVSSINKSTIIGWSPISSKKEKFFYLSSSSVVSYRHAIKILGRFDKRICGSCLIIAWQTLEKFGESGNDFKLI